MKFALKAACIILIALCGFPVLAGYFDDNVIVRVPATASPTSNHGHIAAVFLSGDAGYRLGKGRIIGNRLAADGISVVAINSMGYFRPHRTVGEVAGLIAMAIRQALAFGHADQVVLIGHSFGADALQAGLVDLPQDLRAKVRAVILIAPTDSLYLRISPSEMLDLGEPDAEVLPTLRQLTWVAVTCIYGAKETSSPCPRLSMPNVRKVELPGGHALGWDIARIHSVLLNAIESAAPQQVTKDSALDYPTAMSQAAKPGHR